MLPECGTCWDQKGKCLTSRLPWATALRGCRQLRYGAGFSHSQVVLSRPGFNTEINKTALVCSIFSASWSSNQHIPMKAPWGGRAKKPLRKKKIFQCFFKFVPEVSFLCKWLAQDQTNKGVGRESKISMIPPETTQCPFVEPDSKHSDSTRCPVLGRRHPAAIPINATSDYKLGILPPCPGNRSV